MMESLDIYVNMRIKKGKRKAVIFIESIILSGVFISTTAEEILPEKQIVEGILLETASPEVKCADMTLEEKVAQMFIISPDILTGVSCATESGDVTKTCYEEYPVGGIIYFRENLVSREQIEKMLKDMQMISQNRIGLPIFLSVDEEGGQVSRLYGGSVADIPYIGAMYEIGNSGDLNQAYNTGRIIGQYLRELNFNVDFAPVADIFSNPMNTVIGDRAFGSTADLVSEMVPMAVMGLQDEGIMATLKHFPGHGDTAEDSHSGYAVSYKTLDELRECEFLPFYSGIDAGADFIMMGHISLPNILEDQRPASLSYEIVTDVLRNELGFEGIIITDALNMGAIAAYYSSAEAAVTAVEAGVDMLLMPNDFIAAYEGVINAVYEGRISEERIDEAVIRIIKTKQKIRNDASE